MINVDELFEKRYGGKTARQYFEENQYFTPIEMVNFAKHCIEQAGINTVLCGEGHNEAVIVHGDNTITNDQSQTTTLTAPNGLLPAEGSDLTVCDGIRG